ncbi:MAG: tetratricopeptide repeat protein [Bryobacterales bacterium]|nr:tetratricopeptide repeat protein [Bryobacterales bacterium]
MAPEQIAKVKAVFLHASELAAEQVPAYLDQACAGDAELRGKVERLLSEHAASSSTDLLLQQPAVAGARTIADGDVIAGRFRIVRFAGAGGMGEVYEAEDLELGGRVALKTVRPGLLANPQTLGRFRREIQIARQVTHPSICRVFDVGRDVYKDGDLVFLTMEFLDGETLTSYLKRRGRFLPEAALPLLHQIGAGLDAMHQKGVVHRDLKPGNIILVSPATAPMRAVISDFGLARAFEDEAGNELITKSDVILGTPAYMSPEQLLGKPLTPASDVYSLGLIIYEMLTAERMFTAEGAIEHAVLRVKQEATLPSNPLVPAEYESLIKHCLARDPKQRPSPAGAAISSLTGTVAMPAFQERIVVTSGEGTREGTAVAAPLGRSRKWFRGAALVAIGVAAALAFPQIRSRMWPVANRTGGSAVQAEVRDLLVHYYKPGNIDKAMGVLEQVTAANPKSALAKAELCRAHWLRYLLASSNADLESAKQLCTESIGLDGELAEPHVTLGILYARTGRSDLSTAEVQTALRLDSRNADAYNALADLYRRQGRNNEVEATLQKAIDLSPDDWRFHSALGSFHRDTGKLDPAAASFRRALELSPENGLAHHNLAGVYLRQGRYKEARPHFERAIALSPTHRNYSGMGTLLMLEGNFVDATKMFQKAIDLNPDNYSSWANLAASFAWSPGGKEKAKEGYRKAIALAEEQRKRLPKDADLLADLGGYYAAIGDAEKAMPLVRQALALGPESPSINYRAAEAYELLQRREEALRWIRKAIELGYSLDYIQRSPELALLRADPRFPKAERPKSQ